MPIIEEVEEKTVSVEEQDEEKIQMKKATTLKDEGNDLFRTGKYREAIIRYQTALDALLFLVEKMTEKPIEEPATAATESTESGSATESADRDKDTSTTTTTTTTTKYEDSESDSDDDKDNLNNNNKNNNNYSGSRRAEANKAAAAKENKKEQSKPSAPLTPRDELICTLHSNLAACYLKTLDYDGAIRECDSVLAMDPNHPKALFRRATAYEAQEKYAEALADLEKYADGTPGGRAANQAAIDRLTKKRDEKRKQEMDQMIGQLKELGNSILSKFGLSTDNFQLHKDPNTGSYSINFKK